MALLISFFQICDAVDEENSVNNHINIRFYGDVISINIGIIFSLAITSVWFVFISKDILNRLRKERNNINL
ncbi:hypothetical protein AA15669_1821 [Saccharibacter floricola DSM 15669]|uniref:CcmD family protein n=2 Tax=Saccharibacter TaxID=231052 RepID=A0ABQ0P0V3_9PROT|nr:hypothetical protein AA15669_1821 [Saccharibacter floricola DSM 15669]